MKRILITGGAGFIGSALIAHLKRAEYENIFVADNLSFGRRALAGVKNDRFFEVDVCNGPALEQVVQQVKPQWVIHLAAIHFIPYCNANPAETTAVNTEGTRKILAALRQSPGVEKVFFASTAAVYGILQTPISEDEAVDPQDLYGITKAAGEEIVQNYHWQTGVPVVNCRFFNAFGPNETNPHLIPEIQNQVNNGGRHIKLGNLEPRRDFIHTYDMSRAVRLLMEAEDLTNTTVNLGQGKSYSVRQVVTAFETALGETVHIEQDPARVRKTDRLNLQADISRISGLIDWKPRHSLTDGIKTLLTSHAVE